MKTKQHKCRIAYNYVLPKEQIKNREISEEKKKEIEFCSSCCEEECKKGTCRKLKDFLKGE